MKNFLKNKRLRYILIIIGVSTLLGVFLFTNKIENKVNTNVSINNSISYEIDNVTFNIKSNLDTSSMALYKAQLPNSETISKAAEVLQMTNEIKSDPGQYKFEDFSHNYISLFADGKTIRILNVDNKNLSGFIQDNILTKLGALLNLDLSTYYKVDESISSNELTAYRYEYKIKSYPLITDLNNYNTLRVVLDNKGNLREMMFEVMISSPISIEKLIPFDTIKTNFKNVSKGVYPNFPLTSNTIQGNENIENTQDFKGNIEINGAELAYLWSINQKDLIVPVYRLTAKFHFNTGLVTDGTIIIPAIETK